MAYTVEQIKEKAAPLARKYGVNKLALFGSAARGDSTENSDLDFVVELGELSGLSYFGFAVDLEEEFGVKVDLVTYKTAKKSIFLQNIEEVVLYEKG